MTTLDAWLAFAKADARRRGLPDLDPVLDTLYASVRALRHAEWNDDVQSADAHWVDPQGADLTPSTQGGGPGDADGDAGRHARKDHRA